MDDLDLGATLRGFSPGQKVFGRYTLARILGRGGMGVVWLARDEELEREVALKFLPEVVALDKMSVKELKRETRRSLELTHPHIIRIYDFVQDARAAAISMEYVTGDTLSNLKADRPGHCFGPADLEGWVGQLCDALGYAHGRAQVVHRDLKPANLMIDSRGELKVADFGIAASVSDSVSRVSARAGSSGTPVYMSPQQMMGDKPAVTDDIYSLGATLYDLLTGKPPFFSGNVIAQVQSKVPPTIAARRAELGVEGPAVPEAWERTIAACLAKEAADRPQSAAEVWARLQGKPAAATPVTAVAAPTTARAVPVAAVPAAPPSPVATRAASSVPEPTPTRKSRGPLVTAAIAALIVAGAAGWYFGVHAPAQARLAEERRQAEIRQSERTDLARRVERIEGMLGRAEWASAERELAALAAGIDGRSTEGAVAWADAERSLGARLQREREAARLAALRIPVTLRTNPAGAEIFLEGQSRGLAPLSGLPLPLGEHVIVARLKDHDDLEHRFTVTEQGQTEWTLPLVRSTGTVALAGQPDGATFVIRPVDAVGAPAGPPVASGRLPAAELRLPTGRYEWVVNPVPPVAGLEHRQVFTVAKDAPARLAADVRSTSVRITSQPAGAAVFVDGEEVGRTPHVLASEVPGRNRRIELRLAGHKPATTDLAIPRPDAASPTWGATLEPVPDLQLKLDPRSGPRRLIIEATSDYTGGGTSVAGNQTTPIPETRTQSRVSSTYEILAFGADGLVRSATSTTETSTNGVEIFRPGTIIRFDRTTSGWQSSIAAGGFVNSAMSVDYFTPSYPALWLDERILPGGPAEIGRAWEVPLSSIGVLLPSLRFKSVNGSIRGRVVGADPSPAAGWAEVEYQYQLRGPMSVGSESEESMRKIGQELQLTGDFDGTLTMRLELAAGYVSRAGLVQRGMIESSLVNSAASAPKRGSSLVGTVLAPAAPPVVAQTTLRSRADTQIVARPAGEEGGTFALAAAPSDGVSAFAARREQATFATAAPARVPVYFHRPNNALVGTGATFFVRINGTDVVELRDGQYQIVELSPGSTSAIIHMGNASGMTASSESLQIQPGRPNYFEIKFRVMGAPSIEAQGETEGRAAVARLRPVPGSR